MTTFLLKEDENSGDIFRCYLGNLPSQKEARLTVAYVTELSRETNRSVKFTLPTLLNPRYDSKISLQNTPFGMFDYIMKSVLTETKMGGGGEVVVVVIIW